MHRSNLRRLTTLAFTDRGTIYRFNKVYAMHHLSMMSVDGGAHRAHLRGRLRAAAEPSRSGSIPRQQAAAGQRRRSPQRRPGFLSAWNEKGTFDYPGSRFMHVSARGCDLVISHVSPVVAEAGGPRIYCQCQHAQFKIDRFDRIFVPDALNFEIRVYDSEGNLLARFGGYGNADCKGPKSAKPRPEIPLAWGFSVMVSDRFAYAGDNLNRRIVKVRLTYAGEASCPLP